jgi:hypothetical protein
MMSDLDLWNTSKQLDYYYATPVTNTFSKTPTSLSRIPWSILNTAYNTSFEEAPI